MLSCTLLWPLEIFGSLEKFLDQTPGNRNSSDILVMKLSYTLTYFLPNGRMIKAALTDTDDLRTAGIMAEKILASGVRRVEIQEINTIVFKRENPLRLVPKQTDPETKAPEAGSGESA